MFTMRGQRMAQIRRGLGWSREQLAAFLYRIPEGPQIVADMEDGRRPVTSAVALAMATLADVGPPAPNLWAA